MITRHATVTITAGNLSATHVTNMGRVLKCGGSSEQEAPGLVVSSDANGLITATINSIQALDITVNLWYEKP